MGFCIVPCMRQRVFAKCKKMGDYFICIILHLLLSLLSGAVGHETIWEDDSPDKALWTRTYRRLVECCVQYNAHVCFLVLNKFVFVPLIIVAIRHMLHETLPHLQPS